MFLACYIDWGNEKRENIFTYGGWFTSWIFTHWKQIGLIDSHSFAVHLIYLLIKPNWYSRVWSFNGIKTDKILTFDAKYFAQADSQFLTVSWCCFYLHAIFSQQKDNFHVCLLSFSSFWPSTLLLLSPRAWLWPRSAFQFCPPRRCGIWHAHYFCIQSHCSVHLCWGQDWCEKVGQLFSTLQLQGKNKHLSVTMVTLHTLLSWKV